MKVHEKDLQLVLNRFDVLRRGVIDSSSIIYAQKSGIFEVLQQSILLFTVPEVIQETGLRRHRMTVNDIRGGGTTDHKVLTLASNCPLISEDRKMLLACQSRGGEYYNMLMMLHFLLYRQCISGSEYETYLPSLLTAARYGDRVLQFGEDLHQHIISTSSAHHQHIIRI